MDILESRARELMTRYGSEAVVRTLAAADECKYQLAEYTDWIAVAAEIIRIRAGLTRLVTTSGSVSES